MVWRHNLMRQHNVSIRSSSIDGMKVFAKRGPSGEPIATPYI